MTTDLVAVLQLPSSLELSGPDREAAQAVVLYLGCLAAAGRFMARIEQARAPSPTIGDTQYPLLSTARASKKTRCRSIN